MTHRRMHVVHMLARLPIKAAQRLAAAHSRGVVTVALEAQLRFGAVCAWRARPILQASGTGQGGGNGQGGTT